MTVSNNAGALHLCNEQLTIARGWWSRTLFVGTDDMKEAIITLMRRKRCSPVQVGPSLTSLPVVEACSPLRP